MHDELEPQEPLGRADLPASAPDDHATAPAPPTPPPTRRSGLRSRAVTAAAVVGAGLVGFVVPQAVAGVTHHDSNPTTSNPTPGGDDRPLGGDDFGGRHHDLGPGAGGATPVPPGAGGQPSTGSGGS